MTPLFSVWVPKKKHLLGTGGMVIVCYSYIHHTPIGGIFAGSPNKRTISASASRWYKAAPDICSESIHPILTENSIFKKNKAIWATKKTLLLSMKYWFVNRDQNNPLYTPTNQGFFHCSFTPKPRRPFLRPIRPHQKLQPRKSRCKALPSNDRASAHGSGISACWCTTHRSPHLVSAFSKILRYWSGNLNR